MKQIVAKHPRPVRWFHWINVPVLCMMIYSGLLIYWANDVYAIEIRGVTLIKFFPTWFYEWLALERRLAQGMAWHFLFAWFFALNGLAYVIYTAVSGEWRYLVPNRHTCREAFNVVLHDLRLSRKPLPDRKFNGAQQIAYTSVILMGLGSLLTGLAIYKPTQFSWLAWLLGGYPAARLEHFALTLGYVMFVCIHLTEVVRAGWNNFRAIVTGYEVTTVPEVSHESKTA